MNEYHWNFCSNIFKDGKQYPTIEDWTAIWTTLINRLEQSKKYNSVLFDP